MGPFARKRGGLELRLGEAEAEILAQVVAELRAQLDAPDRPAHLRRLFPDAYPDDADAQREFANYTAGDLAAGKVAALDAVERAMGRGQAKRAIWSTLLDDDEVSSLLAALNDARLTLGTKLAVTEESEEQPIDETSPDAFALSVYRWLGWLESLLVDQLLV